MKILLGSRMRLMVGYILFAAVTIQAVAVDTDKRKRKLLSTEQKSAIEYFQEVALGFEYGNVSAVTRKWKTNMKIFVAGSASTEVRHELDLIIEDINALASDGFQIEIVSKREDSNCFVFFGSEKVYGELYPKQAGLLRKASGLCTVSWNNRDEIVRGHVFVRTEGNSVEEQRHVIREELTQALGFGKDSPRFIDSIFQSKFTLPTTYAPVDRELISLLYHSDMQPGLPATEVEAVLTSILLARAGA